MKAHAKTFGSPAGEPIHRLADSQIGRHTSRGGFTRAANKSASDRVKGNVRTTSGCDESYLITACEWVSPRVARCP